MGKRVFDTTLGELIVALTEEAGHVTFAPGETYNVVSCVLSNMFLHNRLRFKAQDFEIIRQLREEADIFPGR